MQSRWTHFGPAILLLLGVVAISVHGQSTGPSAESGPTIRRTTLTANEVPAALARVAQGALVRMSPAEFDRLIRWNKGTGAGPHLVESRYRARYSVDDGATNLIGTAEWFVRQADVHASRISLPGLQLPMRQAKWSDGQDAVLFKSPSDPHAVLILPAGGDRTLNLDWSARGLPEPGEVRFDLRVPATPLATLELVLPKDIRPVLPQSEALLTGPFPAEEGAQLWRVSFGGMALLELVLRREADKPSPLFVRTNVLHRLVGTEGTARIEFQVESAKVGFSELMIDHDSGLTITSVSMNNLETWYAAPGDSGSGRIVARLREPTRSATVVLTGTFPVPWAPNRWTSPRAWVVGSSRRSERLRIAIGSAFRFSDWSPGGYRLVRGDTVGGRNYEIELEPGTSPANGERPIPPSLLLMPRVDDGGLVVQRSDWTIGPQWESWIVHTTGTASRIAATTRRFRLPEPWEVEEVTANGRAVSWTVLGGSDRELVVDLSGINSTSEGPEVIVRLTRRVTAVKRTAPYPDLFPIGARGRTGTLVIRPDPFLEASASDPLSGSVASVPTTPELLTRPLATEPLLGELRIRPRPSLPRIELESEVVLASKEEVHCRLTVLPGNSPVTELTLWTPVRIATPWTWMNEDGRRIADAMPLPALQAVAHMLTNAPLPLAALQSLVATSALGQLWRIQLPRPIDRQTMLTSAYRSGEGPARTIPVAWVVGAPFRGTLQTPNSVAPERIDARLQADAIAGRQGRRYGYGTGVDRDGRPAPAVMTDEIDGIHLTTLVGPTGNCRAELQFRVRRWSSGSVMVELPGSSSDPIVEVAGCRTDSVFGNVDQRWLFIRVPVSNEWQTVSVRYDLEACAGFLSSQAVSPMPRGPFPPTIVQRTWLVSPNWDVLPGAESSRRVGGIPLPDVRLLSTDDFDATQSQAEQGTTTPEGWTTLTFTGNDVAELRVVRRDRVEPAGWAVALLLAFGAVTIGAPRLRATMLAIIAVAAVIVWGIGPIGADYFARPILFALAVATAIGLFGSRTTVTNGQSRTTLSRGVGVRVIGPTAIALVAGTWVMAQSGMHEEVFELLGEDGRPTAILVPAPLAAKLRPNPDVVITEATLQGARDHGVGRFKARYRLFAFASGSNVLSLPTAGLRMRSITLDGGEPPDVQATGDALRIPIGGAGAHVLELEFTAPIVATNSEREIKIPVPEVPITNLTFDLPAPGSRLRAVNWRGASRLRSSPTSQHLEADLGAGSMVMIQWQEGPDGKATTRVSAASVWQVGGLLAAGFDYRIAGGSVTEVRLAIPAGSEVYRLGVRADANPAGSPRALVRDWQVRPGGDAGGQILVVEFVVPVTGRVVVNLDLVSSVATTNATVVEFPRPLQVTEADNYVAIVGPTGGDLTIGDIAGLTDMTADSFNQTVWKGIDGTPYPSKVNRAFRVTGARPRLTANILYPAPAQLAADTIAWSVQAGRLVGVGETRWTGNGLSLLEWTFPADVTLTELTGRNLLGWSQRAGRVQAWFDRPVADPIVSWRALRPMPVAGVGTVDVPVPGHPSASTDIVISRVRALDGFAIERAPGNSPIEMLPPLVAGELAWRSAGGGSDVLRLQAPVKDARLDLRTTCRMAGARLQTESVLDLSSLPNDRAYFVSLNVRTEGETDVQVTGPSSLIIAESSPLPGQRRWTVFVPSGGATLAKVTIVGVGAAFVPHITARLGPTADVALQHSIRLDGDRLVLADVFGLTQIGPAEWRTTGSAWRARVAQGEPPPVNNTEEKAPVPMTNASPTRLGLPFAIAGGLAVLVVGLAVVRPRNTAPERAAGLGAMAALVFGPPGALLWLIPLYAFFRRMVDLLRWARATS